MLQLLFLTSLLIVKAATSDFDGSGYEYGNDDEPDDDKEIMITGRAVEVRNEEDNIDNEDGSTTIIIIAAVCVVALAIVAIIGVVLFRHHLQRREQGVYSVPVEQDQKGV